MATDHDGELAVNVGTGPDELDVSLVDKGDGTGATVMRERVGLGGERSREALVEPTLKPLLATDYALPVTEVTAAAVLVELRRIGDLIDEQNDMLAHAHQILRPGD